jgi:formate dehydrogenase subunit delta
MSHDPHDAIVKMANDIGHFYRGEPLREDAIAGIANHIRRYWAKRMRDKLVEQAQKPRSGLDELALAAAQRLAAPAPAPPPAKEADSGG